MLIKNLNFRNQNIGLSEKQTKKLIELGIDIDWMPIRPGFGELILIVPDILPDMLPNKPQFIIQKLVTNNGLVLFSVGYYIMEQNKWFYQIVNNSLTEGIFKLICWCAEKGYIDNKFLK